MDIFKYGNKEIDYLKKQDEILGGAIDSIGIIERGINSDPFIALVSSVVGQQISSKAAATVWSRLESLVEKMTPENIYNTCPNKIQSCGMSMKKVAYIKGIARAAISNEIDFNNLESLTDEDIIKQLTKLHGVGVWTAEMLLIFSLNRLDVVSFKDLAIRRGMMNLYKLPNLTKEQFVEYRKKYSPYGSVASLYLWELSHN
jgi:3-methyladenine DNA glycosylase/8-oxoguanine DNA glycosylase